MLVCVFVEEVRGRGEGGWTVEGWDGDGGVVS